MDKEPLIIFVRDTLSSSHLSPSRQVLEEIAGYFEPQSFEKDELFVREGQVSTGSFFMTEGFMRAFTRNPEGEEVTTYFYNSNHHVSEITSLFTRTRSMENIQAVTACHGFFLSIEQLNTLFHSVPEFREFGRAMLVKEFTAYKKRTLSLINQTAEARYSDLINTNPEIFRHVQLKYIASYLGITDSSLSRIRKEFSKKKADGH
ncbi:Crp/Fnr family transcriptional regulator [Chitinophaga varians]|uniref:Crp/Fnr family transcriptional regulator n=1 Tax=Chitinophaga varians TaxID=2202339 RepID=UPI00165FD33F|nr:Crp/Fnr family transcriptional regulator [Chitinophaga varians]MBC9913835.1 Crp/Fnr family transcriptional regulator [Chitinophaga varians]